MCAEEGGRLLDKVFASPEAALADLRGWRVDRGLGLWDELRLCVQLARGGAGQGRQESDPGQQWAGRRRPAARHAAGGQRPGGQADRVVFVAAGHAHASRRPDRIGRRRGRARAAGHARRTHASGGRGHSCLLHADRRRDVDRRGQRGALLRRQAAHPRAGAAGRLRVSAGVSRRPAGQRRAARQQPQLRAGVRQGGAGGHRRGRRDRRRGRDPGRTGRSAGHPGHAGGQEDGRARPGAAGAAPRRRQAARVQRQAGLDAPARWRAGRRRC